jgi:small conductance mechanosensitive channel
MRALLPIIMVCLALLSLPAAAQEAAQEAAQTGSSAASAAAQAAPAIEAGAIERLIETLETPERREQLLTDLRALLAVQAGGAVGSTEPGASAAQVAAPPAAPKRGGAAIGDQISTAVAQHGDRVEAVFNQVIDAISAAEGLPAWLERQATNPARQAFWIEIATVGLALPILVALLARWLTGAMLGKTIRRLREGDAPTLQARIFNGAARTTLEAFTVAAVLAAGWAALFLVPRSFAAERIAEVVIQAIAVHTGIGVLARLVLAPYAPHLRPVALPDGMAAYLYIWTLRLSAVGVTGFVISKTAIPLGAGFVGARALEIAAAGVMAGLLLILVTQLRVPVRTALRGAASAGPAGALLRRIADLWNLLASLYVLVGFGIFVSGAQDGFLFLLRATAITLAAIAVAIILQHLANRLLDQLFHVDADLERRFPGLRKRTDLYRPALKRTVDIVLLLLAAIVVFEGWNAGVISALEAETRSAILCSAGTIAAVLLICVAAWEFTASTIARVLQGTNPDGTPREASSRTKTLLPLLRRAILVALVIFGGLIVLSEIGIDIAPLLAGAGVVGLAIGFGSQALVRDVITGLFILIEDTVSVGDVVTAGGHTGVVEDLSIRTIRLRDVEGSVHIVPFGDVTTVVNLTKDFSYALLDIGVAYREDTDRVADLITEVAAEMQADPDWSPKLLDGIEILGVNELADSAVIIRARIKTRPVQQWGVKREMLRRVKKRFDAEGVEIPFPHTTVYFGVDSAGKAPPAHLLLQSEETARRLEEGAPATAPTTAAPAAPTS